MSDNTVISIGEPIVDLVTTPASPQDNLTFEAFPGGGAANMLAQVSRLGGATAMIGEVGDDFLGQHLLERMSGMGIDVAHVRMAPDKRTGTGFVHLDGSGERSFVFYRDTGRGGRLFTEEDISLVQQAGWFHATSVTLGSTLQRTATIRAVDAALTAGVPVSFDVNYRPALWEQPGEAHAIMLDCCRRAQVVKMSAEERDFLFGPVSNQQCAEQLHDSGVALVCVSLGSCGSFYSGAVGSAECPTARIHATDTTGCGDAFMGTLLHELTSRGGLAYLAAASREDMDEIFTRANAAGAVCSTRSGSMTAVASRAEIEQMLTEVAR
ncbi:MAG: carbohydrate kinase family protein [Propioniciclava sp.]